VQKNQCASPTRFHDSHPPQPPQSLRTPPALPLQTQPQNRVPPLAHPYLYCAPQGGRTFSDRLKRLPPLGFTPQNGRSSPTALERPCSHADPRRLRPRDTPGASADALLLAPLTCYHKSSGCIQRDSAEQNHRRPPTAPVGGSPTSPKTPSIAGGTRGESAHGAASPVFYLFAEAQACRRGCGDVLGAPGGLEGQKPTGPGHPFGIGSGQARFPKVVDLRQCLGGLVGFHGCKITPHRGPCPTSLLVIISITTFSRPT